MPSSNPRYRSYSKRTNIRKRLLLMEDHCALCGKPIDKTLRTPDPMSAEVDEIIPISRGGDPCDRSNVQLVHRICNQRKGNKIIGTDKPSTTRLPLPKSQDWT